MGKRSYGEYNKFDVVYADFGRNPHGVEHLDISQMFGKDGINIR